MAQLARLLVTVLVALTALVGGASAASAHEERDSLFPPGTGTTPTYRPFDEQRPRLVVCKPESAAAVRAMKDPRQRALNERLLAECDYDHLQEAVDAVTVRGTNIYVLPGTYREEPSIDAPCAQGYDGRVVDYPLIVSCGEVINLVTVAGDSTPDTPQTDCNQLCDLQIEGTGERKEDVVLKGGFLPDGEWVKHNGLKADRADGFRLVNMTAELFRENAIYVHETDGYLIDRVNARHNDLYGILTFTSDHGVISNCDASYNGDSGVYPGSAADVNKDNPETGPLSRFAVEIFGCDTHHNALGFSGTAGNSVYFHDNLVHDNGAGYVTDSFVPNHPGMPQDHAWLTRNKIYSNNNNYYEEFIHSGKCDGPPATRGYGEGTVCPAFPVPVGTGVLIAAGNNNFISENEIYDNWRTGVTIFWVPGAIRDDFLPMSQYDTSNGNHVTKNRLGFHPDGLTQPNGTDFFWDEQGVGNCWEGNVSVTGTVTDDVVAPLPDCSTGSRSPVGNLVKTGLNAPCATYDREDEPDPAGCTWFDSPTQPAGRQAAAGEPAPVGSPPGDGGSAGAPPAAGPSTGSTVTAARGTLPATGGTLLPALAGLLLGAGALVLARRRAA